MKTSDLTGAALDWAVTKCEGFDHSIDAGFKEWGMNGWATDWAQGGPLIEREWLEVTPWPNESDEELRWQCKQHDRTDCVAFGPTPLIAAMRCYVASNMGNEVEVPEELMEEA